MPREVHEHFDADGVLTGTTVVTRESMWDEASRGRALRLAEFERNIDRETGLPIAEAFNDQPFIVHSNVVNYAQRAIERQQDADEKHHGDNYQKWSKHRRYYAVVPSPDDLPIPD